MSKGLKRSLRRGNPREQALTATVAMSAANIIGMRATPITIIAAPGAGKIIVVDSILLTMNRTATAFTGGGAVEFRYTNGSGAKVATDIAASVVTTGGAGTEPAISSSPGVPSGGVANAPVVVTNATAAFATGTGTASLYIKFRIVSV
jgi:hypothetical protein